MNPLARVGRLILAMPGIGLLALFSIVPLVLLVVDAVNAPTGLGFDQFARVVENPQYLERLAFTLGMAFVVTVVSIAISWPVAWTIGRHVGERNRPVLLALVIIPFLTSQLLLIYAMMVLLGAKGPLMAPLESLGLAAEGASILYTPWATLVMFVYESISVIVIVLYTAAERIDPRLLAASRTLGAGQVRTFFTVIVPASATQLIAAVGITFVATAGAFAESAVLGGPEGTLFGNIIADRISGGGDDGVTAALAVVLLVASLAVVVVLALLITRVSRPLRPLTDLDTASAPDSARSGRPGRSGQPGRSGRPGPASVRRSRSIPTAAEVLT
ncbi:ABC transporter permease [Brevibacterium sp.]|uniref:ABC transporter permease n=1 Tax=Brevibacterium sp. TaxID=1701 RepID=UPI002812767A|nr:ABC transporter permease [Brevibacterium sp.]